MKKQRLNYSSITHSRKFLSSHRFRHRSLDVITSNASTCTSSSSLLIFWFFFKICQMYRYLFAREKKKASKPLSQATFATANPHAIFACLKFHGLTIFFHMYDARPASLKAFSFLSKEISIRAYNYVLLTGHITIWHIFKGKKQVWGANHKIWFSQSMFKPLNCRVWHDSSVLGLKQMLQLNELTQAKSVSWWHVQLVVHVTTKLLCTVISGIRVKKNA